MLQPPWPLALALVEPQEIGTTVPEATLQVVPADWPWQEIQLDWTTGAAQVTFPAIALLHMPSEGFLVWTQT